MCSVNVRQLFSTGLHEEAGKRLVVNIPIRIRIGLLYTFVRLLVTEAHGLVHEDTLQLVDCDVPILVFVKVVECFNQLLYLLFVLLVSNNPLLSCTNGHDLIIIELTRNLLIKKLKRRQPFSDFVTHAVDNKKCMLSQIV